MKMHIPPENQGQIVEVSYGWHDGEIYRRTYDRSDRSEVIRHLADPWAEAETDAQVLALASWDPWNSAPPVWLDSALDDAPIVEALPEDP